jgi:hypothetical protein
VVVEYNLDFDSNFLVEVDSNFLVDLVSNVRDDDVLDSNFHGVDPSFMVVEVVVDCFDLEL